MPQLFYPFPACLLAATALLATGCHRQYRLLNDDLTPIKPLPTRKQLMMPLPMIERTRSFDSNPGFDTAYIEFNDRGRLFDPLPNRHQVDATLALIRRTKPSNVVLYVHGWNNNSSEDSADVARFRFALSFLSRRLRPQGQLLGIYIGWRGGTLKGGVLGPFTFLTYWSRKQGARRMAYGDLTKIIDELLESTRVAQPDRRFYTIGHSFGARVLEGALQDSSHFKTFFDALEGKNKGVQLPIDLVLLINPATDSMLTKRLVKRAGKLGEESNLEIKHPDWNEDFCRDNPAHRKCRPYPLMVEMSSRGDIPTRWVMPVANFVNWVPPFLFLARPSARLLSAPFTPSLRTHSLRSCGYDPCGAQNGKTEFDFDMPASPLKNNQPLRRRLDRLDGKSPFVWALTVDRELSRNHGDVWNGNVAAMMFALIDPDGEQTYT
ncbi:MAG: hypothetical protein ACRD8O_24405, partial [Bryobacteraceae bacterium]